MHDRFPNISKPGAALSRQLALVIAKGLEAEAGAAPCIVASDLNSPVFAALASTQSSWRGRGVTPMALLGRAGASTEGLVGLDVAIRIAPPEVTSLLREQVIAGSVVWCGGSVRSGGGDVGEGRTFESLSITELRAFGLVFQGLWASAKPLQVVSEDRAAAPTLRPRLAGAAR